jgi:uncharacterized membrane protein YvbJ
LVEWKGCEEGKGMFWLKQCPQCGGDLLDESDVHGSYISCLQCGRTLTVAEEQALRRTARNAATKGAA